MDYSTAPADQPAAKAEQRYIGDLVRENAALSAEVEALRKGSEQAKTLYRETLDRAVQAEREVEALRHALHYIIEYPRVRQHIGTELSNLADAALATGKASPCTYPECGCRPDCGEEWMACKP